MVDERAAGMVGDRAEEPTMSKTIGRAVASLAIVVLSAALVAPEVAGAADRGRHHGRDRHGVVQWNHRRPPRLTMEQRRCLWNELEAARPWTLRSPAARLAAWKAALATCGITGPGGSTTTTTTSTTTTTTTTKPPPIEPN
jgi:hypothetical protein